MQLKERFAALGVTPILISSDPTATSRRFRDKLGISFTVLCDPEHRTADLYGIPIARYQPRSIDYEDGFNQPAMLAFQGEEELFSFVQSPGVTNLWGASGRPAPELILEELERRLAAGAAA